MAECFINELLQTSNCWSNRFSIQNHSTSIAQPQTQIHIGDEYYKALGPLSLYSTLLDYPEAVYS